MSEVKKFLEEAKILKLVIQSHGLEVVTVPSIPVATVDDDEMIVCLSKSMIKLKASEIQKIIKETHELILETKNELKIIFKK